MPLLSHDNMYSLSRAALALLVKREPGGVVMFEKQELYFDTAIQITVGAETVEFKITNPQGN